jgi:CheY-like chemotaxis protein/anti-sigma regulatory factor (Ser/Thr protein kinase)
MFNRGNEGRLHSEKLTTPDGVMELKLRLPSNTKAPSSARRALDPLVAGIDPELLNKIRLLATELITNSVTYADATGDATILVHILVNTEADRILRIEVTDTGSAHMPRKRNPSLDELGGRGLFLVDSLSDRWGVKRANNGDTSVWLEIDRHNTILIVDDEDDERFIIAPGLRSDGWNVEEASSGEEALNRCSRSSFDFILLDQKMTGLSGIEVARTLRKDGFNHPILIFSAYLTPELEIEAKSVPVATLTKLRRTFLTETIRDIRDAALP